MTTDHRRIVVGVDETLGSDVAQRWAIDEARLRGLEIRLVCAYAWRYNRDAARQAQDVSGSDVAALHQAAERVIDLAVDQARAIAGAVPVTGATIEASTVGALLAESATASMLVLGSRQLHATGSFFLSSVGTAVAARSSCPTVITRGPAAYPDAGTRVIVGVDGSADSETVLEFAFDQASRHGVGLHALLCWHPSPLGRPRWFSTTGDQDQQASVWLSECLAGWREKYPDVRVSSSLVHAHPVPGLVAASMGQHLLVIGSHYRRALAASLSGSVSQGVLHHAVCPVAVVPISDADTERLVSS